MKNPVKDDKRGLNARRLRGGGWRSGKEDARNKTHWADERATYFFDDYSFRVVRTKKNEKSSK